MKNILEELYIEELQNREYFNEGLKDLFKKKKKNLSINGEKEANKKLEELEKELDKNYKRMKPSSDFRKKCKDVVKEYNNDFDENLSSSFIPNIDINIFEPISDNGEDGAIEIIQDEQDINMYFAFIIHDLEDTIKDSFGKYFKFDYGDGDEGCLYVSLTQNYFNELLELN